MTRQDSAVVSQCEREIAMETNKDSQLELVCSSRK
jgi:hypothetical protein